MNTNTQKLVFSKIKKQDLGAIEDAINEAKSNLKDFNDEMVAINRKLETGISVASDAISQAMSNLSSVMSQTDDEFYDIQQKAFVVQTELDNLGISSNVDIDKTINDFQAFYDKADSML